MPNNRIGGSGAVTFHVAERTHTFGPAQTVALEGLGSLMTEYEVPNSCIGGSGTATSSCFLSWGPLVFLGLMSAFTRCHWWTLRPGWCQNIADVFDFEAVYQGRWVLGPLTGGPSCRTHARAGILIPVSCLVAAGFLQHLAIDLPWIEAQASTGSLSFLILLTCSLVRLLLEQLSFRSSPGGRFILRFVEWAPSGILCPLAGRGAFPSYGRRARSPRAARTAHCLPARSHRASTWAFLLALLTLPEPVRTEPRLSAPGLLWLALSSPLGSAGMARPGPPTEPSTSSGRPHLIPPEDLIADRGAYVHGRPWYTRDDRESPGPDLRLDPLPLRHIPAAPTREAPWLGICVFTPHYKPITAAVRPDTLTVNHITGIILERVPGVPRDLFDRVVPIKPQRFTGVGYFIRFHSILRHQGPDGHAAVILDLTRAGGRYFSTVLPRRIEYHDLMRFITPLTSYSDQPLCLYVAFFRHPWPADVPVDLKDGDVIIATQGEQAELPRPRFEDLLAPQAQWEDLRHFPPVETTPSTCLLFGDQRFCIPPHHHYRETIVQAVARCLSRRPHDVSMCLFPMEDLDLHGDHCAQTIVAVDRPTPQQEGTPHSGRRDVFVLCDLRPFGQSPRFLHMHYPAVHLPGAISLFELSVPPIYKIEAAGGAADRDDIRVQGNETLLFYPRLRSEVSPEHASHDVSSSSSADSGAPEIQHEEQRLGPDDGRPDAALAGSMGDYEDLFQLGPQVDSMAPTPFASGLDPAGAPGQASLGPDDRGDSPQDPTTATSVVATGLDGVGTGARRDQATGIESTGSSRRPYDPCLLDPSDLAIQRPGLIDDPADEAWMQILAFICTPEFVTETVTAPLRLPCGVDHAIEEIQARRAEVRSACFPELFPVQPQPFRTFIMLMAGPTWGFPRPAALFDCRQLGRGLFSALVPVTATRADFIAVAGLSDEPVGDVFVHGLLQAVPDDHPVDVFTGMLVVFTRPSAHPPATHDLPTMLLSRDHWDAQDDLPSPPTYPATTSPSSLRVGLLGSQSGPTNVLTSGRV